VRVVIVTATTGIVLFAWFVLYPQVQNVRETGSAVVYMAGAIVILAAAWFFMYLSAYVGSLIGKRRVHRSGDGSFPVHRFRRGGRQITILPENVFGIGYEVLPDGRVLDIMPEGVDPNLYLQVRLAVQRTRTMQALTPSDAAIGDAARYQVAAAPKLGAAAMRYAAGSYDREPRRLPLGQSEPPAPAPMIAARPATFTAADLAGRSGWLLGYDSKTNEELELDPLGDPHLAVWGKTRSGKTRNVGMPVATQQALQGHRVVVLDPERGVSWNALSERVAVESLSVDNASLWARVLMYEFERRGRWMEENGVSDMHYGQRTPPLFCLHVDEFHNVRKVLERQAPDAYAALTDALSTIAARGAARGMHMTVYAHVPDDVPVEIAGNVATLTFKQGQNVGNRVGYWHAHELQAGEFAFEGRRFKAFENTLPSLQAMVRQAPQLPAYLEAVQQSARSAESTVYEPPPGAPVEDPAPLRTMILEWREAHPNGTQSEFRQWALGQGVTASKGYVSDVWNGRV